MKGKDRSDTAPTLSASRPSSWVEKTPGVCGGDACIRATRITVWGLVERRKLGASDTEMVAEIPGLSWDDLKVAWEYYDQHREEIDQAIRENEEA